MSDQIKKTKKNQNQYPKVSIFKIIGFGLKLNLKMFPVFFIVINVVGIIHGVSHGVVTFITQQFYDTVADVINKNQDVSRAFLMVAVLGAVYVFKDVLNGLHNYMHQITYKTAGGEMAKLIHQKIAQIDPICFEDVKLHDDMEKASAGADTMTYIINTGMTIFTFYLPYFLFMGFYLHNLKPQFVISIVFVFIPVLLGQLLRTGIIAKFEDKATPIKREYKYYNKAITDREYFKETRILGAYSFFFDKIMLSLKKLSKVEWAANRRTNLLELCINLMSAAGYAGIIYMLVDALLAGEITVGAFAAVFSSIGMLFSIMREMINMHIGNMASNMGKVHNFIRFMELPERKGEYGEPIYEKGIVAENVSFTYPGAENKSVDGVSLTVKAGETVAIVGENGAGKSTLVRLLMGLYVPASGKVILNGLDTSGVNCVSLFKGLSGVFQKFQRYQMTLEENVRISESGRDDTIDSAAEQAGVDIKSSSFPGGASTMLSREFDGIDLSGGEWQRVAIARGLYRTHNVVVLDEPTAAIDPIEESRLYRKFIEISKDKTAIIVTHRLGSTQIADRVIVMDKGKIAEIGSHYELMKRKGLYAEMFNSQAGWYSNSTNNM